MPPTPTLARRDPLDTPAALDPELASFTPMEWTAAHGSAPTPDAGELTALRVLIADDHPLFRRGVARAIARHPRMDLVGEAADGCEALELIERLKPDLALLDLRMPGLTGTEVCAALKERGTVPHTRVVLLSAFEDDELVWAAVAAGATGYVGKTASQLDICDAIERAADGGIALTEGTAEALERGFDERLGRGDDDGGRL